MYVHACACMYVVCVCLNMHIDNSIFMVCFCAIMQEQRDMIYKAANVGKLQILQELTSCGVDITVIINDGVSSCVT